MELLDKLPTDLHFSVIKYLQHPLTVVFNKHVQVTQMHEMKRWMWFYSNGGQLIRNPICVSTIENPLVSEDLDRKIRYPLHPIAVLLKNRIHNIIINDDFIDDDTEDYEQILEYILWEERERVRKSRPSYKIHEMIAHEVAYYNHYNRYNRRRRCKVCVCSSFSEYYFLG